MFPKIAAGRAASSPRLMSALSALSGLLFQAGFFSLISK
jgi:hypothetical protein